VPDGESKLDSRFMHSLQLMPDITVNGFVKGCRLRDAPDLPCCNLVKVARPKSSFYSLTAMQEQRFDGLMPLLVMGSGRSGTTLLMQLLATSRRIAFDREPPYEVRYLTYLLRWALLLGGTYEPDERWNSTENAHPSGSLIGPFPYPDAQMWGWREIWPESFRHAWSLFSGVAARGAAADATVLYYAEKIPHWIPERLRQVIPYKIIVLVRDPRDVFLSVTAFDKKRGFVGFDRLAGDDDWTYARRVTDSYKEVFPMIRDEAGSPNGFLLRYEDMALNLDIEAKRLSDWLGVKLDTGAVKAQVANFAYHMTSNDPQASVERWRREMSAELNDFFVSEIGQEMRHFGYTN
jgi:hypothetical protein